MLEYIVIVEEGPENLSAYVPDLPGCVSTGRNRKELLKNIREAIEFHIEGMKADGEPVPPPTLTAERVSVAA